MDLHDEPILDAHLRHLGEHLRAKQLAILGTGAVRADPLVERLCFVGTEIGGEGGGVAVVGRRCAHRLEIGAALTMAVEIAAPAGGIAACHLRQAIEPGTKAWPVWIDDQVGPVGGNDPPGPPRGANGFVPAEVVKRAVGGGDDLEIEALVERARPVAGLGETFRDVVIGGIGGLGGQGFGEAKQRLERDIEPQLRGGAAKEIIVLREAPPDGAAIGFDRPSIAAGHAQIREIDALAHEHAGDVMVRNHEQLRGVREWQVLGIPAGVGVPVRADDRQVADRLEEFARNRPGRGVGGEQAVEHYLSGLSTLTMGAPGPRSSSRKAPPCPGEQDGGRGNFFS